MSFNCHGIFKRKTTTLIENEIFFSMMFNKKHIERLLLWYGIDNQQQNWAVNMHFNIWGLFRFKTV